MTFSFKEVVTLQLKRIFLVRTQENLVTIEVKARNTVSKSLRTSIESKFCLTITYDIKFAHPNIGRTDTIITFPY